MEKLEEFKIAVRQIFGNEEVKTDCNDPILFLYSFDQFDSSEVDEVKIENTSINANCCFGKILRAAVLVEQLFPNDLLYSGLVCENLFRDMLLGRRFEEKHWGDNSYIKEILQYEEARIVLVDVKGNHFDPLFKKISYTPENLSHPLVEVHDLWEGLHSFYLVVSAVVARKNNELNKYCKLLFRVNSLYSSNSLVKETLSRLHSLFSRTGKAVELVNEITLNHKNAKTLFYLWEITGDEVYKNMIINDYNIKMFDYLDNLYFKLLELSPVIRKYYNALSEIEKDDFLKQQRKPGKISEDKIGTYCSLYISEST